MRIFNTTMLIILFAVILLLSYLNVGETAKFTYWPGKTADPLPLAFLIPAAIGCGIVYAGILSIAEQLRLRFIIRQMKKNVKSLEDEIRALREEARRAALAQEPKVPGALKEWGTAEREAGEPAEEEPDESDEAVDRESKPE
jgi:uncharacterized integral membrane protein